MGLPETSTSWPWGARLANGGSAARASILLFAPGGHVLTNPVIPSVTTRCRSSSSPHGVSGASNGLRCHGRALADRRCSVQDPEGNEYIDMLSAYSYVASRASPDPCSRPSISQRGQSGMSRAACVRVTPASHTVQGHCHPKIVATLIAQAQKLTLSSRAFYNAVFPRFAQQMTTTFGYERVLPMNTGAEAVETALKVARKWAYEAPDKAVAAGKAVVLSAAGNFHGRTLGVIRCVGVSRRGLCAAEVCGQYEHGRGESGWVRTVSRRRRAVVHGPGGRRADDSVWGNRGSQAGV